MIPASEAVRAINRERGDAIVVGTMTPNRYWDRVTEKKDLDLPIFGGMGKASSVALGVALAQPDRKVICLDGEGGLLMNLGSLVTVAGMEPKNFMHICFDDGVYHTTGSQPVPGAGKYNLADIARGSGIEESYQFDNFEDFAVELPELMKKQGPIFVCLKISHSDDTPEFYMGSTAAEMQKLAKRLQQGE